MDRDDSAGSPPPVRARQGVLNSSKQAFGRGPTRKLGPRIRSDKYNIDSRPFFTSYICGNPTHARRLPVSNSADFEVSAERLWEAISEPGNLNDSHPFCDSNEVISWEDGDRSDRLVHLRA